MRPRRFGGAASEELAAATGGSGGDDRVVAGATSAPGSDGRGLRAAAGGGGGFEGLVTGFGAGSRSVVAAGVTGPAPRPSRDVCGGIIGTSMCGEGGLSP
jgi:hypothetical protein